MKRKRTPKSNLALLYELEDSLYEVQDRDIFPAALIDNFIYQVGDLIDLYEKFKPDLKRIFQEAEELIKDLEEQEKYDSLRDTQQHVFEVQKHLYDVIGNLENRGVVHDKSKMMPPEKPIFDEYSPKLAKCTYGSEEYFSYLKEMDAALQHHYKENDHHPEHFEDGIHGMDLMQLTEMLCDWKAATLRHENGDILRSIQINAERFGYGSEIQKLLELTVKNLGWREEPQEKQGI